MSAYLIRRLGTSIIILIGISIFIFGMLHIIFPSPALTVLGPRANTALINAYNRDHGFDKPVLVQYLHYMNLLVHGDLGYSYKRTQPVEAVIAEYLPKTLVLVGTATVIALIIAIPLGILQVVKRNTPADYGLTALSFIFYAMPPFLLGTLLIIFFSFDHHLLPSQPPSDASAWAVFTDPRAFIMPMITLCAITIASFSRYMRSSMMDALAEDYIRTARAKGANQRVVLYGHALRNALIPILTLIGLSLPAIVSGALITENVFNYPGMGYLTVQAAQNDDIPLVLGTTLVITVATVFGSLLADILYAVADPRIRFGRAAA